MNIGAFIKSKAIAFLKVFNLYDAGKRWSPNFGYVYTPLQAPWFDASAEVISVVREKTTDFEHNNAIFNHLADLWEQFTVGVGLQVIPSTGKEDFDAMADAKFATWSNYPDIASRQNFGCLQGLMTRHWFRDGKCYVIKTAEELDLKDPKSRRYPRIQLVSAERCKNPIKPEDLAGRTIIQGHEINPRTGRTIAYWLDTTINGTKEYRRWEAKDVIEIGEPNYAGMYDTLPLITCAIQDLWHLNDLQKMEQKAALDAANTTKVITTATGEVDDSDMLKRVRSTDANGVEEVEYYRKAFGGETKVMKTGDKYEQHVSARPSVAVQWYWRHLLSKVCAGVGIPVQLAFPESIQGTVERAELDIAAGFFRSRSDIIAAVCREIYAYVIQWEMQNDAVFSKLAPTNWYEVEIVPPRAPNVDVGRNSSAMLAELAAGATTLKDIYGPLGKNWRKQIDQSAIEAAYVRAAAIKRGVTPGEISIQAANAMKTQAEMEAASDSTEPEKPMEDSNAS